MKHLTPEEANEEAEGLAKLHETVAEGPGRASSLTAEALMRFRAGDVAQTRSLLNRSFDQAPGHCEARLIAYQLALDTTNRRPLARATTAWCPTSSLGWEYKFYIERGEDRDLDDIRTAFELTNGTARTALPFGEGLITEGLVEEARGVASRYLSTDREAIVGEYLLARVEIASGALAAGLDRLETLIESLEMLGREGAMLADWSAVVSAVEFAQLVGREREMADMVLERFLLGDPLRIHEGGTMTLSLITNYASPAVAERAAKLLPELVASGRMWKVKEMGPYLEGVLAAQRGDYEGAVEAWRPLVPKAVFRQHLLPEVFDEAGQGDLAWTIAEADIERAGHNVTLMHARQAQRALRRGDRQRARALAQRFVDAWQTADTEVLLLDEMRGLLSGE
jgi:hypothetical protein